MKALMNSVLFFKRQQLGKHPTPPPSKFMNFFCDEGSTAREARAYCGWQCSLQAILGLSTLVAVFQALE